MTDQITPEKIDELLQFLPAFRQHDRSFVEWRGRETQADGAITLPYPEYPKDVLDFFRLAAQPSWCDYSYDPQQARTMLEDEAFIRKATLMEIKTILTYCVRGERFSEGLWGEMLESGKVVMILERLIVIRNEG